MTDTRTRTPADVGPRDAMSILLAALAAFEAVGLVLAWALCRSAADADSVAREAITTQKRDG
jgi:hypothetical protein